MRLSSMAGALLLGIATAAPLSAQSASDSTAFLHFQIIEADGFTARDPQIREVEKELRDVFKFKGYRLAAEAYMRVGSFGVFRQVVFSDNDSTRYIIEGRTGNVTAGVAPLQIELSVGGNTALQTSATVPFGQTVVVGTARPDARRAALILVVIPTHRAGDKH